VLLRRHVRNGYEVTVRSGASGRAASGADVSLYRYDYQRGHREIERKRTGDDGRVRFAHTHWRRDQYFLMARRGEDLALDSDRLYPYDEGERGVSSSALIYTDRSVYRPQQTLYWKAVAYRGGGEDIRYETDALIIFNTTFLSWGPFNYRNDLARITVTVRPKEETRSLVRSSVQYEIRAVEDPEMYQKFFRVLEQSLFLSAQRDETP